ncbi:protein of unknown function [Candidatus Nitrosocaldus cavascurensis]|jgi:hypothetical protein|uniref:Uncharacterized protein n=2 Tax=Candidatus Nitrosocaldaceae TaxID=1968910 RepID=A0A2K5AQD0_9ARCH|nr:protein of unknown function [Candidatus Nitrosocaldus cavascurensis]
MERMGFFPARGDTNQLLMDVARYIALKIFFSLGIIEGIRLAMKSELVVCRQDSITKFANVSEGYRSVYGVCIKHGRRYTLAICLDRDLSIHSYLDMLELARRVSHEITHLYAFENHAEDARRIHYYIDSAVKEGREVEMVAYRDMHVKIDGKVISLKVYDVKETCRRALQQ